MARRKISIDDRIEQQITDKLSKDSIVSYWKCGIINY